MLRKMLAGTFFAVLALACLPVLAGETECDAAVCQDGTWPEMQVAMAPIALDQPADAALIAEMVSGYTETVEAAAEKEPSLHMHQVARLDEIVKQMERP